MADDFLAKWRLRGTNSSPFRGIPQGARRGPRGEGRAVLDLRGTGPGVPEPYICGLTPRSLRAVSSFLTPCSDLPAVQSFTPSAWSAFAVLTLGAVPCVVIAESHCFSSELH